MAKLCVQNFLHYILSFQCIYHFINKFIFSGPIAIATVAFLYIRALHFYRAMHKVQSAVLLLEVVRLSVRLSACDVGDLWSYWFGLLRK